MVGSQSQTLRRGFLNIMGGNFVDTVVVVTMVVVCVVGSNENWLI